MREIRTGEIMTMKKFHSQWAETEIEVPLVRASSGRISGPYTVMLLALLSNGDGAASMLEVEPAQSLCKGV
jgi:fumarylacetoacetate (FAA) hydrolase family protein